MAWQPDPTNDDWYESEASTRQGMIAEIQRIRRRTRVRPISVLLLASLITGAVAYRVITKKALVEADVVLALTEGSLSAKHNGIPVDQLKDYVANVLMPKAKLAEVIERRNLYPLRRKLGIDFAIEELRGQFEIQIWKNTFMYFDEDAQNAQHSARIGLTVADTDPDRAIELARDLAAVVMSSVNEQRQEMSKKVATEIAVAREQLSARIEQLARDRMQAELALDEAHRAGKEGVAQAINLQIIAIDRELKSADKEQSTIATSRDALADRITQAGLDMSIQVVEEHHPEPNEHRSFVLVLVLVVVGMGALLGAATVVGAFDPRIHDTDDVARLGLPVLGHVPEFPGDNVGSLQARGALRRRVPSFRRWRSNR